MQVGSQIYGFILGQTLLMFNNQVINVCTEKIIDKSTGNCDWKC